ncbi:RWD domain-containing protein 2B [Trichinella pseudospiralis]|uniref:RWD domain-containing protein 2B n=1 Tax=Trichinella pseudospiralis TaxID=6337 RepID=A0A0V1J1A6_TRIPS|nr:RWD domain-containing protein 2B [Trichinella pseudospiralis]KRZ43352.1 RWD domain-containing protein 2B [Trichinella pseudospiralis]
MLSIILKLLIIAFINFQLCTCSSDTDKVEVEEMVFSVPLFKPQNVPQIKEKKLKKLLEPLGKLYKTPSDVGTPISSSEASESVEKMIFELNRLIQAKYSYIFKQYHKLKTVHQAEKCDSTTNVYTITLQKTDCKAEQIIKGSPSTNCSNVEDSHPISCTILSKVTSENETIIGAFCHVNMQKKLAKKKSICELFRYPGEEKFKTFVPKEVSSLFADAIVYIPQGQRPQPNEKYYKNYRGRQGIVGRGMLPHLGPVQMHVVTIFRKNGEQTEVLSLLNSNASIEIPKVFVTDAINRPFGDEIDRILKKAFDTTDLSSAEKEEKLQKLYNATYSTLVDHRETPYDTDDAYVITEVVAVFDENKKHIGSIDKFPSDGDLQIGWKVADKSALRLMRFVLPSEGIFHKLFSELQLLCKDCLKMQLEEITVLRSMFREPEELTFDSIENLSELQAFVENEAAFLENTSLESVSFSLKLKNEANCALVLSVELPFTYPLCKPPVVVIGCSSLDCHKLDALNAQLGQYISSRFAQAPFLYDIAQWICETKISTDEAPVEGSVVSLPTTSQQPDELNVFCRYWIYSHHIYNKVKRRGMLELAKQLNLTGFCLPGKPGVVCVEGNQQDCNQFWKQVRKWNWKKISLKHAEEENSSLFVRKFGTFEELNFATHPGSRHMDFGLLYKFMADHGCGDMFTFCFGMQGRDSNS